MSNEQSLTNIYNTMVSNNEIQINISQQTLVSELEKLTRKLEQNKALNVSIAGRVFPKFRFTKALEKQGVYIHGGVGIGKSMLMDLFLNTELEGKEEDTFS